MSLEIFKYMPDDPTEIELNNWFLALFHYLGANIEIADFEVLKALDVLSDRQWHSLKPANEDIINRVDNWIKSHWEIDDSRYQSKLFRVLGALGLIKSLEYIHNNYKLSSKISPDTKIYIQKLIAENREYVVNPYCKMMPKKD